MGNPPKSLPLLFTILTILQFAPHTRPEPDFTTVLYKDCSNQSFPDPSGASSQAISTIFGNLLAQSSTKKFFKTTASAGQSSIDGLFQCRGDLSNADCSSCVSNLPTLIDRLCGVRPIAARLHLAGCYMMYEVSSGYSRTSGMDMLYEDCSEKNAGGSGFEERRDTSLSALEDGMSGSGVRDGFYGARVDSVYAMGQCEGDVGPADCADCVRSAVQRAQVECGSSAAGRIYLNKCYIGYGFDPNGTPKRSASASFNSPYSSSSSSGTRPNTGKTMAVILGGAALVGFLVIFILFARRLAKKKDDY